MDDEASLRAGRADRLQRVGIPPAASRAYVALLELGETEAREVARLSGIPFAKVYAALDHLHTRGLVNIILDSPRRYSPKPVDEYLANLRKVREEELRMLDLERRALSDLLRVQGGTTADDRGTFSMVRGRRGSLKKITDLVQKAREDVFILATHNFASGAHLGESLLQDASRRGVDIRILAHRANPRSAELYEALPNADVRLIDADEGTRNTAMLVTDRTCALIVQFVPDDMDPRHGHDVGIVTTQPGVVLSINSLLLARWNAAAPKEPRASKITR